MIIFKWIASYSSFIYFSSFFCFSSYSWDCDNSFLELSISSCIIYSCYFNFSICALKSLSSCALIAFSILTTCSFFFILANSVFNLSSNYSFAIFNDLADFYPSSIRFWSNCSFIYDSYSLSSSRSYLSDLSY